MELKFVVDDRQTDTIVLNPVISPEREGDRIHLNVVKDFDLEKLKLMQKLDLLEQKYFTWSMPLLTPSHSFQTCGWVSAWSMPLLTPSHSFQTYG